MAILSENMLEFKSNSVEQTVRLGVRLGELIENGELICLVGELGAGKTAMARGIGRGWGSPLRVTSPTFTLANVYPRARDGQVLYHFDCYRLSGPADAITAGFEDLLDSGAPIMVEWPERILELLPDDRLWIELRHISPTRRQFRMEAEGEKSAALLSAFKQSAFGF